MHAHAYNNTHLRLARPNANSHGDDQDPKTMKSSTPTVSCMPDPAYVAQNIANEDMDTVVRALARRPVGRQAILNSPTVVRAINENKKSVRRQHKCNRDKKLSKLVAMAARAKGCATKAKKKLNCVEARRKGLQTKLSQVHMIIAYNYLASPPA